MLSKRELTEVISELEESPRSYQDCAKLATFYSLYDHLYPEVMQGYSGQAETVSGYGDSEFLRAIAGKDTAFAWGLMDELMSAIKVLNPRLYDSVLRKLD
jgi:hypothetical protein